MNPILVIAILVGTAVLVLAISRAMTIPPDPAALYEKIDRACVNDIHVTINRGLMAEGVQHAIGKPLDVAWNQYYVDNACLMLASPVAMRIIAELPPERSRGLAEAGAPLAQARAAEARTRGIDLTNAENFATQVAAGIRAAR